MRYPIESASSVPGSGNSVYLYLLMNINIPSRLPHEIWYSGLAEKLKNPHSIFKGFFPVGETFEIQYGGAEMQNYTFTGEEKNPVYVNDLSASAKFKLGIPNDADKREKVFNPNFVPYEKLPPLAKTSNETVSMSLAKSISSFLCVRKSVLYTEQDVVNMLSAAVKKASSDEMIHILHGNHIAWCTLAFMRTNKMEEDIKKEFYTQNGIDFYTKDIGTIMPSILYTLAILGVDPVASIEDLDYDLYGIENVARKLQTHMKNFQKKAT